MSEYILIARGGSWPVGEGLVLDSARGKSIAIIRDEPWPEVLERPWPDGAKGRPWLWRLLGVGRNPRQSRTVVRRLDDGYPLVRLHRREPLLQKTIGIFDSEDQRVGYCRWPSKGAGSHDQFTLAWVDHRPIAEVCRAEVGVYRVSAVDGAGEWARVTVSRGGATPEASAACRVTLNNATFDREKNEIFLLAAALVLFLSGLEVRRTRRNT